MLSRTYYLVIFVAAGLSTMVPSALYAEENSETKEQPYLSLGIGTFDVFDEDYAMIELGYRSPAIWKDLRIQAGILANQESDMYLYVGSHYTFSLTDHIYASPSVAAGFYHDEEGIDLGGSLQFQSALEVGYVFDNNIQLGAKYAHFSNAGIYDENPGTEALTLQISTPF